MGSRTGAPSTHSVRFPAAAARETAGPEPAVPFAATFTAGRSSLCCEVGAVATTTQQLDAAPPTAVALAPARGPRAPRPLRPTSGLCTLRAARLAAAPPTAMAFAPARGSGAPRPLRPTTGLRTLLTARLAAAPPTAVAFAPARGSSAPRPLRPTTGPCTLHTARLAAARLSDCSLRRLARATASSRIIAAVVAAFSKMEARYTLAPSLPRRGDGGGGGGGDGGGKPLVAAPWGPTPLSCRQTGLKRARRGVRIVVLARAHPVCASHYATHNPPIRHLALLLRCCLAAYE